jgi:hypothetical protein
MHYAPGAWKNDTTELYAKNKNKKNHGNNMREMRDTEKNRERSIQERSKQLTCHADRGAEKGGRGETTAGEPD